jgi:hypothetical protein
MMGKGDINFLLRAKRATYAAGMPPGAPSRPGSHDLTYQEDRYLYIDSYLGEERFIGQEAVWLADGTEDRLSWRVVWGMNYYGWMLVRPFPEGFSTFLKEALLQVPVENPYRGPRIYKNNGFTYECEWQGDPDCFNGEERIMRHQTAVYRLLFHGGSAL